MKKINIILLIITFMLFGFGKVLVKANSEDYLDDYVTDNLVSFYSYEYNNKIKQDLSSSVWNSLVGDSQINLTINSNNYFTSDGFLLNSTKQYFPSSDVNVINGNEFTFELLVSDLNPKGTDFNTFVNSNNDNFALFRRVSSDELEFKFAGVSQSARPIVKNASSILENALISITYKVSGNVKIYINGELKAEKSCSNKMGAGDLFFGHSESTRNYEMLFKSIRIYSKELTSNEIEKNAKADGMYGSIVKEESYITLKSPKTNIVGGISAIKDINTIDEYNDLMRSSYTPTTYILHLNDNLDIVDENAQKIGTIDDYFDKTYYWVIPAFYITNQAQADKLIKKLKNLNFYDCFVVSSNSELIKYTRTTLPKISSCLDLSNRYSNALTKEDIINIRETVHSNWVNVCILDNEVVDKDIINKLFSEIVYTWIKLDDDANDVELMQSILSGAIGIIYDYTDIVYDIAINDIKELTVTRSPLNIGHRGLPTVAPENTIESALEAYNNGADVIELDIYLTKDNEIVIMHDASTARTCNKSLNVESSTLAELKNLYVNVGHEKDKYHECKIPTLREYFELFKDKDVKLFIEIKSYKESIIPLTKALIEEYDMYSKVSFISFTTSQLLALKKYYPEATAGLLCYLVVGDEEPDKEMRNILTSITPYNSTLNPNVSGYGEMAPIACFARGVGIYPWTLNTMEDYYLAYLAGYAGITGNDARILGDIEKDIEVINLKETYNVNDSLDLECISIKYNKEENNINEKVEVIILEGKNNINVVGTNLTMKQAGLVSFVICYTYELAGYSTSLYSDIYTLNIESNQNELENKDIKNDNSGCNKALSIINYSFMITSMFVLIMLKKKRF